jgi:hypothetical protein
MCLEHPLTIQKLGIFIAAIININNFQKILLLSKSNCCFHSPTIGVNHFLIQFVSYTLV